MSKLKKIWRTCFVAPLKDYLIGAGCAYNITGNYYPTKYSRKNRRAVANDMSKVWEKVGAYLYEAMGMRPPKNISSYNESHKKQTANHVRRILTAYLRHKRRQRGEFAERA